MNKKTCTTEVKSISDRKMSFTITTSAKDRDNDTISVQGWILDDYLKNPVVLFGHKYDELPIAKTTQIWATANGLHAEIEWPERGVYPFADTVHDMIAGGFLSGTSVGFRPIAQRPNKDGGWDITQASLLEWSVVPVPCNPETLAMRRGLNAKALQQWLGLEVGAIQKSGTDEPIEIDLTKCLQSANEIEVSAEDLQRAMTELAPAFAEAVRSGMRIQAQHAAKAYVNRMTGRLD